MDNLVICEFGKVNDRLDQMIALLSEGGSGSPSPSIGYSWIFGYAASDGRLVRVRIDSSGIPTMWEINANTQIVGDTVVKYETNRIYNNVVDYTLVSTGVTTMGPDVVQTTLSLAPNTYHQITGTVVSGSMKLTKSGKQSYYLVGQSFSHDASTLLPQGYVFEVLEPNTIVRITTTN